MLVGRTPDDDWHRPWAVRGQHDRQDEHCKSRPCDATKLGASAGSSAGGVKERCDVEADGVLPRRQAGVLADELTKVHPAREK